MRSYYSDIQKRREKRLAELRKNREFPQRDKSPSFLEVESEQDLKLRFIIKTMVSITLLVSIYFTYQINHPYANTTQKFINEFMTREYNFEAVQKWYSKNLKGYPAILPTFSIKEKEAEKSTMVLLSPLNAEPTTIKQTNNGVFLQTEKKEPVVSIGKGIILSVSQSDNLGKTIRIRHQNGIESTYGFLQDITVSKDEWVEPGQTLGHVEGNLYFTLNNETEFLNPTSIIPFQ